MRIYAHLTEKKISIHAPRTGSDRLGQCATIRPLISIHAPRTGSDSIPLVLHVSSRHFNPRSPHGERQNGHIPARNVDDFNPRSPHGERRDTLPIRTQKSGKISIHAPRTGSDFLASALKPAEQYFNPRSPHGERHIFAAFSVSMILHFNPRSPHGERRFHPRLDGEREVISIHAPRTGSDPGSPGGSPDRLHFNPRSPHGERPGFECPCCTRPAISIHAPRTGSDWYLKLTDGREAISIHAPRTGSDRLRGAWYIPADKTFQSTLPARGATGHYDIQIMKSGFQSTLPARGATSLVFVALCGTVSFQSTLPARGATDGFLRNRQKPDISIHAPRTGSDVWSSDRVIDCIISIHAPRTGSDAEGEERIVRVTISIHAPRTGSDIIHSVKGRYEIISIHAPRTGSDETFMLAAWRVWIFQSTLPARGATCCLCIYNVSFAISIHAPRTGSDTVAVNRRAKPGEFQSTLPARGATLPLSANTVPAYNFNPRSPHGERRR